MKRISVVLAVLMMSSITGMAQNWRLMMSRVEEHTI